MRLPNPIERLLEPGPPKLTEQRENPWLLLGSNIELGHPVIDVEFGYVPPWYEGPIARGVPT